MDTNGNYSSQRKLNNEDIIERIQEGIFNKYNEYIQSWSMGCNYYKTKVSAAQNVLKTVCHEIKVDLRVMLNRRGDLIGKDKETELSRLSRGKIAGIAVFRLAKAHIIHLDAHCLNCCEMQYKKGKPPCVVSMLNTETAFIIGVYLIDKDYNKIPENIRRELLYTLTSRHTNQETLGIIFDTFREFVPPKSTTPP